MLGIDTEGFFIDNKGLAVPALVAFENQKSVKMKKVHKDIPTDIKPDGYPSLMGKFRSSALVEDGLAFEITTEPSDKPKILVNRIRQAIKQALNIGTELGLGVVATPFVDFDPSWVVSQAELRVLGCNPDFSVHGSSRLAYQPTQDPKKTFWRTGGGHIHFSIPGILDNPELITDLVLLCDATLGLADVLIEHSELGRKRREMYGQPGKFRVQPWGVEYRTPSNVWMANPELAEVFLTMSSFIHTSVESRLRYHNLNINQVAVSEAIYEASVGKAIRLLEYNLGRIQRSGYGVPNEVYSILDMMDDLERNYSLESWL